jgi:hypothetical protein
MGKKIHLFMRLEGKQQKLKNVFFKQITFAA